MSAPFPRRQQDELRGELSPAERAVKQQQRYTRAPWLDKRIRRGDDFAGDAWTDDQDGSVRYTAVGCRP